MKHQKRRHQPHWKDSTIKQRQARRRAALNSIARTAGYQSWTAFETACIKRILGEEKAGLILGNTPGKETTK